MNRNIQTTRSPLVTSILAGLVSASFTAAALAAGVGGGAGATIGTGPGAQVTGPGQAQVGGNAEVNRSPAGSANTNTQWQDGATRGADRAAERTERTKGTGEAAFELEATGKADAKGNRPAMP